MFALPVLWDLCEFGPLRAGFLVLVEAAGEESCLATGRGIAGRGSGDGKGRLRAIWDGSDTPGWKRLIGRAINGTIRGTVSRLPLRGTADSLPAVFRREIQATD